MIPSLIHRPGQIQLASVFMRVIQPTLCTPPSVNSKGRVNEEILHANLHTTFLRATCSKGWEKIGDYETVSLGLNE
jgi:hypothetical protein